MRPPPRLPDTSLSSSLGGLLAHTSPPSSHDVHNIVDASSINAIRVPDGDDIHCEVLANSMCEIDAATAIPTRVNPKDITTRDGDTLDRRIEPIARFARAAFAAGLGDDAVMIADTVRSGSSDTESQDIGIQLDDQEDRGSSPRKRSVRWIFSPRATRSFVVLVCILVAMLAGTLFFTSRRHITEIPGASAQESRAYTENSADEHSADDVNISGSTASDSDGKNVEDSVVVVYVSGAVLKPGVVEVEQGARVIDAVTAAGGLTEQANSAAINLAALIADGQHIHVPAQGEDPSVLGAESGAVPDVGGAGTASSGGAVGAGDASASPLINLNTATQAQLESIPGVGPVMAQRIIEWRQEHGQFSNVRQLLDVDGIGEKTLEKIADYVNVQ